MTHATCAIAAALLRGHADAQAPAPARPDLWTRDPKASQVVRFLTGLLRWQPPLRSHLVRESERKKTLNGVFRLPNMVVRR